MSSKRPHTKSRLGCQQCKTRRIKCDQKAPCCGSCNKKGIECEYKEYAGVSPYMPLQIVLQHTTTSSTHSLAVSTDNAGFSADDMLLMHHYTLYTCKTMGLVDDPAYHDFWQIRVPSLAYQYPFLLHAILSITAAHKSLFDLSRRHYGQAIVAFTTTSGNSLQEEGKQADAVFCYAIAIMLITWTLECTHCPSQDDPLIGVNDLFGVIRTAIQMLRTMQPGLVTREITAHMWHLRVEPVPFPIPERVALAINRLDESILEQQQLYTADEVSALHETCEHLRWFFSVVKVHPSNAIYFVKWVTKLSSDYLDLLRRHDGAAMAILTFWCIPLHHSPNQWYLEDWPRQVVLQVSQSLRGSIWAPNIDWPLSEIGHNDEVVSTSPDQHDN